MIPHIRQDDRDSWMFDNGIIGEKILFLDGIKLSDETHTILLEMMDT